MKQAIQETWTKQDLMAIAKYQKNILWLILLSLAAVFIPFGTIATGIISIYFIYKFAVSLRSSVAWLYIILAFIPIIGIIALVHINGKANRLLKDNDIKVGLMGARFADFDKIEEA